MKMKNKQLMFVAFCLGVIASHSLTIEFANAQNRSPWFLTEISVDGYRCVNPNCPECIIDRDLVWNPDIRQLSTGTEYIFKNGFESD